MTRCLAVSIVGFVSMLTPMQVRRTRRPPFTRTEDVIYGRKFGTALTMDVFTPEEERQRPAAVILVVSGGWFSSHEAISPGFVDAAARPRLHRLRRRPRQPAASSRSPRSSQDMNRAVRFIRYHAKDYEIDPDRIGIYGGSAGGHLSLMQGTAGDQGDPKAKDPVDRVSSRVQAVACFFPPTDFLNYGKPGENAIGRGILDELPAPRSTSTSSTRRPRTLRAGHRRGEDPRDRPADLARSTTSRPTTRRP